MQNQIYPYVNKIFSKYKCCFQKGFSAHHCLIAMTQKLCQSFDSGWQAAEVLTDLLKAFYCIDHELPIAKLNVNSIIQALSLSIHSFLKESKEL